MSAGNAMAWNGCRQCYGAGHMVNGSNRPWGQAGYVNGPRMGHMPHQHHTCVGSAPFGYGNAHGYNCIHGYQCNAGYTLAPGYMYSSPNGYSSPNLANLRLPQAGPVAGTNNSPRRGKTWQQGGQGKPSNRRRPAAQGAVTATTQVAQISKASSATSTPTNTTSIKVITPQLTEESREAGILMKTNQVFAQILTKVAKGTGLTDCTEGIWVPRAARTGAFVPAIASFHPTNTQVHAPINLTKPLVDFTST